MRRWIAGGAALLLAAGVSGCAHREKKPKGAAEVLGAEQTLVRYEDAMARHQLRKAKTLLGKIQFTPEERPTYEPLVRLGLADSTYYLGDDLSLIEARSKYLDFVTLYGDHERAPYAQFQAGMCSVKQIYSATRDQAQTRVAIDDFEAVGKRWPDSAYARAARQFVAKGYDGLAEHEYVVGTFYRKKRSYDAATDRYRGLLQSYPNYRAKDKVYYWLGWTLFHNRGEAQGRVYLDQVVRDYPKGKYAKSAGKLLAASDKKEIGKGGAAGAGVTRAAAPSAR